MPSAITGRLLRYFTPDPLLELLHREAARPVIQRSPDDELALILLLSRPAAFHIPTSSFDNRQANRLASAALGYLDCQAPEALMALGREISPRVSGLREEIVFSGAGSASYASHVFAPHGVLPSHLQQLADAVNDLPVGMDPAAAASIAGFYGAHLHPFLDGNGRWSRLLSVCVGARLGGPGSGLISSLYQAHLKNKLVEEIWPHSRMHGFDMYLHVGSEFESALRQTLADSKGLSCTQELLRVLKRYSSSRRMFERYVIRLFSHGGSAIASAKEELGLSSKRAVGLSQEFQRISDALGSSSGIQGFFNLLTSDALCHVDAAVDHVLRGCR